MHVVAMAALINIFSIATNEMAKNECAGGRP